MIQLCEMNVAEMKAYLTENGFAGYRASQIFRWIHHDLATDFQSMTNLPLDMRKFLAENCELCVPQIVREQVSAAKDTVKLLLEMSDGAKIEMVIMLYDNTDSHDRQTVCISTQVGCAMGCAFCATGLSGFERNLTASEIVAQVLTASRWLIAHGHKPISNVVYMGMGEPLLNLDNVLKSLELLHDEGGQNISGRKFTISTCGLIPQIMELADQQLTLSLAVSLHAPNDELRNRLMPINRKYNIGELNRACRAYADKTGRRITYEYAMFDGINDDTGCAEQLGRLLRGQLAHVNLIPANHVDGTGFGPSKRDKIEKFAFIVRSFGIEVTIRAERGADIDAACGQLRRKTMKNEH